MIQEWWGLNDQICGVADRFARAGYNALAPDLYKGRVTQKPDEANHMMSGLDFVGASDQDIAGAVKHLAGIGGKVASWASAWAARSPSRPARASPGIAAGVPFYGVPPGQLADPARIKVPIQGHFANTDDWCTPAARRRVREGDERRADRSRRSTATTRPTPSPASAARPTM